MNFTLITQPHHVKLRAALAAAVRCAAGGHAYLSFSQWCWRWPQPSALQVMPREVEAAFIRAVWGPGDVHQQGVLP